MFELISFSQNGVLMNTFPVKINTVNFLNIIVFLRNHLSTDETKSS